MPRKVLEALLKWLPDVQNWPESRFIHIRTPPGLSTVIVWCHYVLDLDMHVSVRGKGIQGPPNAHLDGQICGSQNITATLYISVKPKEQLYVLEETRQNAYAETDLRFEASKFGIRALERIYTDPAHVGAASAWIVHEALKYTNSKSKS